MFGTTVNTSELPGAPRLFKVFCEREKASASERVTISLPVGWFQVFVTVTLNGFRSPASYPTIRLRKV